MAVFVFLYLLGAHSHICTCLINHKVAAQQGEYLAQCLNKMKECHEHPEGPLRITKSGRHFFRPFRSFVCPFTFLMNCCSPSVSDIIKGKILWRIMWRYKHFGQFAPLGGEQAAAELPGDWVSFGHSTQWLWYSVYARYNIFFCCF